MIYTITFNPSLDYIVRAREITIDSINRAESETILCGGKGINVSLVLAEFGIESTALGFVAGFTGAELEKRVHDKGVGTDFVRLEEGFTRINVKLRTKSHETEKTHETDINCNGPQIGKSDIDALVRRVEGLSDGDMLVMGGSAQKSIPTDICKTIANSLKERRVKVIVDTHGKMLLDTLSCRPFLVKPNREELCELFGLDKDTALDGDRTLDLAERLQKMGAQNVLVSLGADGAVLLDADGKTHFSPAQGGAAVDSVGAGDSMIAGFIAGYLKHRSYSQALRYGIAAGGATACREGLATREEIEKILS